MSRNIEFYDPQPLMSYNAHFNFVLDVRGRGKTFSLAKKKPIDDFLKTGEQFIYLRRYKEELKDLSTFFADIEFMYPNHEFEVKGRTLYCDKKVIGYAVNLSTANMKKSVAYPKVTKIIFDEFILEKGFVRYIPNEVKTFLNFYETVARTRDNVKAYFIGNAISLTNPYFLEFKIIVDTTQRFTSLQSFRNEHGVKEHLMLVEIGQDDSNFRDMKKQSRFGMITQGTEFASSGIENIFLDQHDTFIEKRHPKSLFVFAIHYMGHTYGIWQSGHTGLIYVSMQYDKNTHKQFALTTDDFKVNMVLVDSMRNNNSLALLRRSFTRGYLRFENTAIRSVMYDVLKLIS